MKKSHEITESRPSKNNTTFISNIHIYRAKMKLSQNELAKRVGVARITIMQLEMNKYNPSFLLAADIAHVLNTTIDRLFTLTYNDKKTESRN